MSCKPFNLNCKTTKKHDNIINIKVTESDFYRCNLDILCIIFLAMFGHPTNQTNRILPLEGLKCHTQIFYVNISHIA